MVVQTDILKFVPCSDYSLRDAATTAYAQTCAPYHTWAIRTAVYAGMYALPSRDQLLLNLCETGEYRVHFCRNMCVFRFYMIIEMNLEDGFLMTCLLLNRAILLCE